MHQNVLFMSVCLFARYTLLRLYFISFQAWSGIPNYRHVTFHGTCRRHVAQKDLTKRVCMLGNMVGEHFTTVYIELCATHWLQFLIYWIRVLQSRSIYTRIKGFLSGFALANLQTQVESTSPDKWF